MRMLLAVLTLCVALAGQPPARAAEPTPIDFTVEQERIQNIKIFSKDQNRIHFFVTDNNQKKYRIPNLTQDAAAQILAHFKKGDSLVFSTTPNKRGYLDVLDWKKKQ